jgi:hypothetical protein
MNENRFDFYVEKFTLKKIKREKRMHQMKRNLFVKNDDVLMILKYVKIQQ